MKILRFPLGIHILVIFALLSFLPPIGHTAESTEDVVVDSQQKEKIRQEFTGNLVKGKTDEEYTIGYRDILLVSLYGEGSMATGVDSGPAPEGQDNDFVRDRGRGVEVRTDGRISLKHIGDVSVIGMTLTQLADYLKKLYSTIYENAAVTVTLVQSNSRYYTVMGQVRAPGLYHLDFPITIVNAVAKAGGLTEWANSKVTVIRQQKSDSHKASSESDAPKDRDSDKESDKKKQTFKFDFDDFLDGEDIDKNITLMHNDVMIVH